MKSLTQANCLLHLYNLYYLVDQATFYILSLPLFCFKNISNKYNVFIIFLIFKFYAIELFVIMTQSGRS